MRLFKALSVLAKAEAFLWDYLLMRAAVNTIGDKLKAAAAIQAPLSLDPAEVAMLAKLTTRVEQLTSFLRTKLD